ncbi:uncharacterized protein LOC111253207 isoform X2 [Varroa destructor]|uniref:Uncharacterized protein n=1 Tax=Varroa destructor TaxID=109461 RepID=A0A7M7KK12_VARDE|nr:uncharacterized protein LOC111253207 isoform X2 [Varroa destructor]
MKDKSLRFFHRAELLEQNDLRSLCIRRLATILVQKGFTHIGQDRRRGVRVPSLQREFYKITASTFNCIKPPQSEEDQRAVLTLSCLPSVLAEDLLEACVALVAPKGILRYGHIADVLASGRLVRLSLWDVETSAKDLSAIARKTCGNLQELEVDGVAVRGRRPESVLRAFHSFERLIEANVRTLKCVNIGLALNDLLMLSGLRRLENLTLNFDCAYHLNQLIIRNKNREYIWPRLRSFRYGDFFSAPTKRFVCHLLQKCPLLSHVDTNIADSLQHLHANEFLAGGSQLSKRYPRIEKAVLGSFIYATEDMGARIRGASVLSVQIAASALIHLRDLDLYLDSHDAILVLGEFIQLERLRLMWVNKEEEGTFTRSLETLLTEVGCQLKELCVHSFVNVDVHEISSLCPYLDSLGIIECRTQYGPQVRLCSFEQLQRFRFIPPRCYPAQQASLDLLNILYGSEGLEKFIVEFKEAEDELTKLVDEIVKINPLSKLFMAGLYFSQASADQAIDGLFKLISSWKNLRYLTLGDPEILQIVKESCPNLKVRHEYLYVGL